MTTVETLNQKVQSVLGTKYVANNTKGLSFKVSGYSIAPSVVIETISSKVTAEELQEIKKLAMLVAFGK